jgi:hypothetical protein
VPILQTKNCVARKASGVPSRAFPKRTRRGNASQISANIGSDPAGMQRCPREEQTCSASLPVAGRAAIKKRAGIPANARPQISRTFHLVLDRTREKAAAFEVFSGELKIGAAWEYPGQEGRNMSRSSVNSFLTSHCYKLDQCRIVCREMSWAL